MLALIRSAEACRGKHVQRGWLRKGTAHGDDPRGTLTSGARGDMASRGMISLMEAQVVRPSRAAGLWGIRKRSHD
jgi:hypothetical protein